MKQITTIFTAVLVLLLTACNNQPKPAEETTAVDTAEAVTTPVFTPYNAMMVQFTVKDFDKWYASFLSNDSMRRANGLTETIAGRGTENDKSALVFGVVADLQKARDFAASPGLKERMKKNGVVGAPAISFVNVIRDDTSTIPQHERVMVTVHVKDFDAWLKVYDGEGLETRAANGLVDRGMTRDLDDPNTVSVLFAITDLAKAKARFASPELKKLMDDSGVDSQPKFVWFKWIE